MLLVVKWNMLKPEVRVWIQSRVDQSTLKSETWNLKTLVKALNVRSLDDFSLIFAAFFRRPAAIVQNVCWSCQVLNDTQADEILEQVKCGWDSTGDLEIATKDQLSEGFWSFSFWLDEMCCSCSPDMPYVLQTLNA